MPCLQLQFRVLGPFIDNYWYLSKTLYLSISKKLINNKNLFLYYSPFVLIFFLKNLFYLNCPLKTDLIKRPNIFRPRVLKMSIWIFSQKKLILWKLEIQKEITWILEFPQSTTMILSSLSVVIPVGPLNCPWFKPFEPKLNLNWPWQSKIFMQWL